MPSEFTYTDVAKLMNDALKSQKVYADTMRSVYEARILVSGANNSNVELAKKMFSSGIPGANSVASNWASRAIAEMATDELNKMISKFSVYQAEFLDENLSKGYLGKASRKITKALHIGESAHMAMVQYLVNSARVTVESQIKDINSLSSLISSALGLIDGIAGGDLYAHELKKVKESTEKIEFVEIGLTKVRARLENDNVFEASRYEDMMSLMTEAQSALALGDSDEKILSREHREILLKDVGDQLLDFLDITVKSFDLMSGIIDGHEEFKSKSSGIVGFEGRLASAIKRASPYLDDIENFIKRIRNTRTIMEESSKDDSKTKFICYIPKWMVQLGLIRGMIDLQLNPVVIASLKEGSDAILAREEFVDLIANLQGLEMYDKIKDPMREGQAAIVKFVDLLSGDGDPEEVKNSLKSYNSYLSGLIYKYTQAEDALSGVDGNTSEDIDELLELFAISEPALSGWKKLFDMGRIDLLADLNLTLATQGGLMGFAMQSLDLSRVPRLKSYFDKLVNYAIELKEEQEAESEATEEQQASDVEALERERDKYEQMSLDTEKGLAAVEDLEALEEQIKGTLPPDEYLSSRQRSLVSFGQ